MLCIWCKQPSKKYAKEHIIPEVLGCPDGFWLEQGEVCAKCNNDLGHLDSALADSFDFVRFFAGLPGKKGKLPKITSRSNITISWEGNHPIIEINLGSKKVRAGSGRILNPPIDKLTSVRGSFETEGPLGTVTLKVPVAHDPKLPRALHKISLAALVKLHSYEHVMQPHYDAVREFVRKGIGNREVLLGPPIEQDYYHYIVPMPDSNGFCDMMIVLCRNNFYVDLSPSQIAIPKLKDALRSIYGDKG